MTYTIFDLIGNLGVFLIITSYLLLQLNKIKSDNILYSLMNLIGVSLVIVSLIENFNMSAFVIEVFWVAISFLGFVKYIRNTYISKSL